MKPVVSREAGTIRRLGSDTNDWTGSGRRSIRVVAGQVAAAQIPVGRFADPTEIARAVGFLASQDSGYITGTDLSVNGGYHIA